MAPTFAADDKPGAATQESKGAETPTLPTIASATKDSSNGSVFSSPDMTAAVLTYLQKRGFNRVEAAFKAEIEALAAGATPEQAAAAAEVHGRAPTVSLDDLAAKNAPKDGEKEKDSTAHNSSNSLPDPDVTVADDGDVSTAATQALLLDPTDRARGFSTLKAWCHGSLDIYQPELLPILLPLFVHSFLDLVSMGHGAAASAFYTAHAPSFLPTHTALLSQIRSLALPSHIQSDSLAQRFRSERYVVKMSNIVFSLLLGWLTDGGGSNALDEAEAPAKRAREAMLKIINERCRIQVLGVQPYQIDAAVLEEGTGLTGAGPTFSSTSGGSLRSRIHPALAKNAVSDADAVAEFNARAAGPQLKLHPAVPLSERLETEVAKQLQEAETRETDALAALRAQDASSNKPAESNLESELQDTDQDTTMQDVSTTTAKPADQGESSERRQASEIPTSTTPALGPDYSNGLLAPNVTDLPPQAPTFRTIDIKREVQKIRDARKRIRLDPSGILSEATGARTSTRIAALPSVCAYTFHDADDGITCSTFSQDVTLMASGFEESFVQLWSLKGEKLRSVRGNPNLGSIRDSKGLHRQREAEEDCYTTRRLIGHSGPVYGVDFDPVGGSASAPRHLLSCSADSTARLWSLDTYSALVAYRGHQHPVWDVKWSPLGGASYFATASADKTARLWSTERVNPLRIYAGHLSDVDCLAFHPNSLYLATGSSDRSCRLWDVQRGACVRLFVGHQSGISCVKVSPDGRYLASAGAGNGTASQFAEVDGHDPTSRGTYTNDVSISLWDLGSGRRIKKMWGHKERIYSMDFSADGSVLVTGSEDCTVRCWDVRSVGGARTSTSTPLDQQMPTSAVPSVHGITSLANNTSASSAAAVFANAATDANTSADCVATFHTKRTPIINVHFTPRNLCLVAGVYED